MKIVCLGGGPAGVYQAILMKLKDPGHDISVYERNRAGDTFGWGVVFSDQTMENLHANDPASAHAMTDELIHWDYIDIHINGHRERSGGHGFIGIGRKRLLQIIYERAIELGVNIHFETEFEVEDIERRFANADLIVAADGINSKIRNSDHKHFQVDIDPRVNRKLKCPLFRILKCLLVDKEMAVSVIMCLSSFQPTVAVSLPAPVPTTRPCASLSTGNFHP